MAIIQVLCDWKEWYPWHHTYCYNVVLAHQSEYGTSTMVKHLAIKAHKAKPLK
jgi:hypothetical protein